MGVDEEAEEAYCSSALFISTNPVTIQPKIYKIHIYPHVTKAKIIKFIPYVEQIHVVFYILFPKILNFEKCFKFISFFPEVLDFEKNILYIKI